ncbi:hypothetical protein [Streptomyces sp. NPDC056061]|uniref:hypothetical protein n=1 Tax=Streptomyces sp. NPDC056061 TaxID=3345700 RepID=UPI0035E37F1A
MHPDTHLVLHHSRSAELHEEATQFRTVGTEPRAGVRTRLGWTLVELGLRILPRHHSGSGRGSLALGPA